MTPQPDRPLVLFVDDVAEIRELYRLVLEDGGYCVAEAVDGDEAVRQASALLPAVIVMDLLMPILDGAEASRRLKQNGPTSGIPIIALTGQPAPPHAEHEALFAAYLTKPCLPDELLTEIRRLAPVPRAIFYHPPRAASQPTPPPVPDASPGRARRRGRERLL